MYSVFGQNNRSFQGQKKYDILWEKPKRQKEICFLYLPQLDGICLGFLWCKRKEANQSCTAIECLHFWNFIFLKVDRWIRICLVWHPSLADLPGVIENVCISDIQQSTICFQTVDAHMFCSSNSNAHQPPSQVIHCSVFSKSSWPQVQLRKITTNLSKKFRKQSKLKIL